ncbi:MAG: hypothetical protein AAF673_05960, partial [Pseudomonadota bacterium]
STIPFSHTIPFVFYPYIDEQSNFVCSKKLMKGEQVTVIPKQKSVCSLFNFVLDDIYRYTVSIQLLRA